jgi:hypothetical protein
MPSTVFSFSEFTDRISQFAAVVPRLLAKHHRTSDLAIELSDLITVAERPFTMAVVGQMRSGKSSLLNALVGRDLAVTGVNETTATINWFKWGQGTQCDSFRVTWKDKPAELYPLSEASNWIGDSENAKLTSFIEYYSDANFLKRANIIDTPGTRSVLQDHTDTVRDFLEFDTEDGGESLGAKADAILYVLMPVARQNDADFLKEFESSTRLPNCSAYNSIAVVHKWEVLGDSNAIETVQDKVDRIRDSLSGLVSTVIPASAPLATSAVQFGDAFWSQILKFSKNSHASAVADLLLMEDDFINYDGIKGCELALSDRQALRSEYQIPWPCFKVICQVAGQENVSNSADLRKEIHALSGIKKLNDTLHDRFFARSKMIKHFSVLSKAWDPCQIALGRLRQHEKLLLNVSAQAAQCRELIDESASKVLLAYVEQTESITQTELESVHSINEELEAYVIRLTDTFSDMQADLKALETLDDIASDSELPLDTLRRVCGAFGPEIENRSSSFAQFPDAVSAILDTLELVRRTQLGADRNLKDCLEHLVIRLEQLADYFDELNEAK